MTLRALVIVLGLARAAIALADAEVDADRAYRGAVERAAAGDPAALDAFEQLGAARPITRWTDNAWSEAARLAERRGDYTRARRALEHVITSGTDPALVRRARASLQRLVDSTGGGRWDAIVREHERLAGEVFGGGDPQAALEELERLVHANPQYPRATDAVLALAQGWERDGEPDRGIAQLRAALAFGDRERLGMALARALIRRGELADADAALVTLAAAPGADRATIAKVREDLDVASRRAWIRRLVWLALAVLAAVAAVAARRDAGSWRAAVRRLARPPSEAVFLLPVGGVLVGVALTGNPLVARALVGIVLAGIAVAWISGALLEARRARAGRVGTNRAIVQTVLAVAVVAGAAYLAIDRDRMLDLVEETVEHGPRQR